MLKKLQTFFYIIFFIGLLAFGIYKNHKKNPPPPVPNPVGTIQTTPQTIAGPLYSDEIKNNDILKIVADNLPDVLNALELHLASIKRYGNPVKRHYYCSDDSLRELGYQYCLFLDKLGQKLEYEKYDIPESDKSEFGNQYVNMARGITYRTLWPGERYELVDHSRMAKALYFLDQKYVPTTLGYGIILNLLDGNNLKYSGGYRGFYYLEDDYFPFIKYEKNDANSINNYGKSLLDNCKRSVEKFSGKITQQDNEIISDFKYWNKPYKRLYWNNYYRRSQDDIDKSDLADITDLNKIDISDDPVPAKGRYIPKIRDPIARKTIDSLFYSEIPKLQKAYKEYIAVPNTRKFDELIVEYLYFMEMVGRGIARTCPDVPMINESEETVVQRDETRKYEALINENPGSDRVKIMEIIEILNGGRFFFVNTNMVRVALTVLKPVNFSNYWEDTSSSTDILGKLYSAYDIMQEIIISKGIKAKNMDNMTELIFYECRKCFDSGIDPVYGLTGIDIRSNGIWRKQLNNFYDGRDPMYAIEIPEKRNKPEIER